MRFFHSMIALHVAVTSIAVMLEHGSQPALAPAALSPPAVVVMAGTEATLGQEFDLRIGGTVAISGERLDVTFELVVEDSRCPTSTTCIWEGDAVVRVTLRGADRAGETLILHTQAKAREGSFQNYRARLVRLLPVPRETGRIPSEEYVATLTIFRDK